MRGAFVAIAVLSVTCWVGGQAYAATQAASDAQTQQGGSTQARQSTQGAKSSGDGQESGKPSGKPSGKQAGKEAKASPASSPADENPFPEAVSQRAAEAKERGQAPNNPAPPAKSSNGSPASDANPFPQAVSQKAAEAAQKKKSAQPQYSSSQESSLTGAGGESTGAPVSDPARAKEDVKVGDYYMDSGDYRGAYLRFKDAIKYDQANLAAIFGLAQSSRKVGKYDEAARNFRIYLAVEPKGSKAKEARKALREMAGK